MMLSVLQKECHSDPGRPDGEVKIDPFWVRHYSGPNRAGQDERR